jgi:hypothetical protein
MGVQWDDRLISQAEAFAIAGAHPVEWHSHPEGGGLVLRCRDCQQSCGQWRPKAPTSADDMIAAVLRHLVMAHDLPLNKAARKEWERERAERAAAADGGAGRAEPGKARPGPGALGRRGRRAADHARDAAPGGDDGRAGADRKEDR